MLSDQIDDRGAHHHAIGDPRDSFGLFGRPYAEANRDGKIGGGFQARDSFLDRCLRRLLQPVMPATDT